MRFSYALLSLAALTLSSPVPDLGDRDLAPVERETSLNAFLSLLLDSVPNLDASINDIAGILTDIENTLAVLTGEQTTYNQLGGTCTAYTVIFARGTTEPGNVGILVGPPFFDALKSAVGSSAVTIQGVNDYAASIEGYVEGGDPTGSAEMAAQITQAYNSCPNTKLVASGYSQGGQLVHNALGLLPADIASWVSKVVIFGDPDDGTAIPNVAASKVDTYCNAGDNICVDGDIITVFHLTYGLDATAAAKFVTS